MDIITKILETADTETTVELVHYVLDCVVTVVSSRRFKDEVLLELNNVILGLPQPDYHAICKIIVQLNSSEGASRLFKSLLASKDPDSTLIAYQCAFDLVASGSQQLLNEVAAEFKDNETLAKILSGVPTCDYDLTFLNQNNNTDTQMLNRTKNSLDPKSSMNHSAVTFANAFLHAGTAQDSFIRSNLDWLSKASNWTKLSATAALGVIHKGNLSQGRRILAPYLPQGDNAASGSPYTREALCTPLVSSLQAMATRCSTTFSSRLKTQHPTTEAMLCCTVPVWVSVWLAWAPERPLFTTN